MDIGKGAEALGEELGVFGKRVTSGKTSVVVTAVASPVGSSSSSVASASIVSQRAVETTAAVVADETGEENSAAQFLEQEICDNIYLGCLAKVTTMSLSARASAEGIAQEAKEWAAAEQKAQRDVDKRKKELTKATKERTVAYKEMESADASFHGRDYVSKASADFKVKECAEQLAEARVATAEATLFAIRVQDTAQNSGAKNDLMDAIEEERLALQALEEARVHAVEQNIASASIPMAEAIAVEAFPIYPDHQSYPYNQHFSPLNVSPERSAQERQEEVSAKKEKAAAAFETEFTETIREAKAQVEEVAEAAETAREKAEKEGNSEKLWNKAIEGAEIAEGAYTHLVEFYQMYSEQAAEHYEGGMLKTKCSKYKIELTKAERKKNHWINEVEECKQKQEALKQGESEKTLEQTQIAEAKAAQEREVVRIAEQARIESERKAEVDRIEQESVRKQTEEKAAAEKVLKEKQEQERKEKQIHQIETSKKLQEARSKASTAIGDCLSCWKEAIGLFEKSIAYEVQAIEAEEAGKKILAAVYREAAETYQKAADAEKLAAERHSAKKTDEQDSWSLQKKSLLSKADCQVKAGEAHVAGKIELAIGYHEAAESYQRAADQYKKAVLAKAARGQKYNDSYNVLQRVASAIEKEASMRAEKTDYQAKANEAQEAGQSVLAAAYREAGETLQRAVEAQKQAVERYVANKCWEGGSWGHQAESLLSKAKYQAKVGEAEEVGKIELIVSYREVAEIYQRAADLYGEAVLAKVAGGEHDEKRLKEAICLEEAASVTRAEANARVKKADYEAKANEMQKTGKVEVAAAYREVAETFQRAADQYKQAAVAKVAGREDDYKRLKGAASEVGSDNVSYGEVSNRVQKANCEVQAWEAKEAGKIELVASYQEAAEAYQRVADQYKKAALAKVAGRKDEDQRLREAARVAEGKASCRQSKANYEAQAWKAKEAGKMELAASYREVAEAYQRGEAGEAHLRAEKIDYQIKASEAQEAGTIELAAAYREVVEIYQRKADYWKEAILAKATGRENDFRRLCAAVDSDTTKWEVHDRMEKADYEAKACEAQKAGKIELAVAYREVVEAYQRKADYYKQSILAIAAGRENDYQRLSEVAKGNGVRSVAYEMDDRIRKADYVAKVSEAQKAGRMELEATYREIVEVYQRVADAKKQASEKHAQGKKDKTNRLGFVGLSDDEINCWRNLGRMLGKKAVYQVKAHEAQEAGKIEFVAAYREVAEVHQREANYWKEAALAKAAGRENDYKHWSEVVWNSRGHEEADAIIKKADYVAKASEAEEAGKIEFVAAYREVAEAYQREADYYKEAVLAKAAGRENDYKRLEEAALDSSNEASFRAAKPSEMARAEEAQKAGRIEIAVIYREIAEANQRRANYYKESALAKATGRENDYQHWKEAVKATQEEVCYRNSEDRYQTQAIEAKEAGKIELVTSCQEAAEANQRVADQCKKAVRAKIEGCENDYKYWKEVASATGYEASTRSHKADYEVKASEAQESGGVELAVTYREVAATYQRLINLCKEIAAKVARREDDYERFKEMLEMTYHCIWKEAAARLRKVDCQIEANEAQKNGNIERRAACREKAEVYQKAADQYKEAVLAKIEGRENDYKRLEKQAEAIEKEVDKRGVHIGRHTH